MAETIYTIPINEVFEENMQENACRCPFCVLAGKLESEELEIILGASMMEPDIRIKTNEQGFCANHFSKMLRIAKRLPLALMLESHLNEVSDKLGKKGIFKPSPEKYGKMLSDLASSCYVCGRIEANEKRLLSNAAYMWKVDDEFRKKFRAQPYFCLDHAARLLDAAKNELSKKELADFTSELSDLQNSFLSTLCEDVSKFAKSFDYRYASEPLTDEEKTSVERSIRYLSGDAAAPIKDA
ncbi:MAG: DUF6062 family protein [Eubacteriales bacterium]